MKQIKKQKKIASLFPLLILITIIASACGKIEQSSAGPDNYASENSTISVIDSVNSALDESIKLSWNAPRTNADDTKLTDLAGYIVYFGGKNSTNYTYARDVGDSTYIEINDLWSGTWCFTVAAYDYAGNESKVSAEACKTL